MFNLTNISVKEFFQLDEDTSLKYVELQSIMKSQDTFLKSRAIPLGQLSFGEVATLKRNIQNPTYESLMDSFKLVFKVKQNQYLNADVVSFFYALNFIREKVIELNQKEKVLESEIEPELEMAGVKSLSVFGEMATLINLGERYSKCPTEIESWKYNLVFAILLYDKKKGEVQQKYQKIKAEANGRKG